MMYPQAELENYKLQVELLQEKLQRSEEGRQSLEHKLEHILHKRHDLEKKSRSQARHRIQEFLDEQQKRNERNKMLLDMLERVDQHTAALSARSERLRMMKMQYEMYFAKLVQNQTMRCIQQAAAPNATTPAASYVLMPTTAGVQTLVATPAAVPTPTPVPTVITIKSNELTTVPRKSSAFDASVAHQPLMKPTPQRATGALDRLGGGLVYGRYGDMYGAADSDDLTSRLAKLPSRFEPAMTTAMPGSGNTATAAAGQFDDYNDLLPMNRNISNIAGYSKSLGGRRYGDEGGSGNIDEMPTLHALDNEYDKRIGNVEADGASVDDALRRRLPRLLPTRGRLGHEDYLNATQDDDRHSAAVRLSEPGAGNIPAGHGHGQGGDAEDNEQMSAPAPRRPPLTTEAAYASDAPTMTFDKLPKSTMTRNNLRKPYDNDATRYHGEAGDNFMPDRGGCDGGGAVAFQRGVAGDKEFAFPNPRSYNDAEADSASNAASQVEVVRDSSVSGGGDVNRRQKIDEAWQSAAMEQRTYDGEPAAFTADLAGIKHNEPRPAGYIATTTSTVTTSSTTKTMSATTSSLAMTENGGTSTGGFGEAVAHPTTMGRVDNSQDVKATPALPHSATAPSPAVAPAKLSFENIESAIYGELVNPPEQRPDPARQQQQSLFEDLVTTTPQATPSTQTESQQAAATKEISPPEPTPAADYANYPYDRGQSAEGPGESEATSTSISSSSYQQDEPTYATIEGTTNAQVYPQPPPSDTSYSSNTTSAPQYQPYGVEGQTVEDQQQSADTPQDYTNMEYANYDPNAQYDSIAQYDTNAQYDPNVYPGYTYDETTGQYTADPNTGYNQDPSYSSQGYEMQQYATNQQDPSASYDYGDYSQTTAGSAVAAESYDQQQQQQTEQPTQEAQQTAQDPAVTTEPSPGAAVASNPETSKTDQVPQSEAPSAQLPPKVTKPTSILSTAAEKQAEKQAADKKKKRVNFVESSDTDESAALKAAATAGTAQQPSSESDFEFSSSGEPAAPKTS